LPLLDELIEPKLCSGLRSNTYCSDPTTEKDDCLLVLIGKPAPFPFSRIFCSNEIWSKLWLFYE